MSNKLTLDDIIEIAADAYPTELDVIRNSWDSRRQLPVNGAGDTLALFIVCELKDVYAPDASDHDKLAEAVRVIERAQSDISAVANALDARLLREYEDEQ